jgi:hypothetical protein
MHFEEAFSVDGDLSGGLFPPIAGAIQQLETNHEEMLGTTGKAIGKAPMDLRSSLRSVMAKESSDLAAEIDDITTKVENNRLERTKIAHGVRKMKAFARSKDDSRHYLANELHQIDKRFHIEEAIEKKAELQRAAEMIRQVEQKQALLASRLSNIDAEYSSRDFEKANSQDKRRWLERFEHISSATDPETLEHTDAAIQEAQYAASTEEQRLHLAVAAELAYGLQKEHDAQHSRFAQEQTKLVRERVQLERQLTKIAARNREAFNVDASANTADKQSQSTNASLPLPSVTADETKDEMLFLAESAEHRLAGVSSEMVGRMRDMMAEQDWMTHLPRNQLWQDMEARYRVCKDTGEQLAIDSDELRGFFLGLQDKQAIYDSEQGATVLDNNLKVVLRELVLEVNDSFCRNVASQLINISRVMGSELQMSLIKAVAGSDSRSADARDNTGRFYLYGGCLADVRRSRLTSQGTELRDNSHPPVMARTQAIATHARSAPQVRTKWASAIDGTISTIRAVLSTANEVGRLALRTLEDKFWEHSDFEPAATGSDPVAPNAVRNPGRISYTSQQRPVVLRLFSRHSQQASLLVTGSATGVLTVHRVPWNPERAAKDLRLVTSNDNFVSGLRSAERSPVVDVRDSLNGSNFVSLDARGCVRLWSVQAVDLNGNHNSKKAPHSRFFFLSDFSRVQTQEMICLFQTDLWNFNVPQVNPHEKYTTKNRKAVAAQRMKVNQGNYGTVIVPLSKSERKAFEIPQEKNRAVRICYHAQCTVTGTQPAVMVGLENGSIFKINVDRCNPQMDAKLMHLPPFVDLEYENPRDAPTIEHVLLRGQANRKGNMVHREIFTFHHAPIVLLETLGLTSSTLISLDRTGLLARWTYSKANFSGQCRFFPERTAQLSAVWKDFIPRDSEAAALGLLPEEPDFWRCMDACLEPDEAVLKKLELWTLYEDGDEGSMLEIFKPIYALDDRILRVYARHSGAFKSSADEVHAHRGIEWLVCPVREVDHRTKLHSACLTPDGSDIVLCVRISDANATTAQTQTHAQAQTQPNLSASVTAVTAGLKYRLLVLDPETLALRRPHPLIKLSQPADEVLDVLPVSPVLRFCVRSLPLLPLCPPSAFLCFHIFSSLPLSGPRHMIYPEYAPSLLLGTWVYPHRKFLPPYLSLFLSLFLTLALVLERIGSHLARNRITGCGYSYQIGRLTTAPVEP